MPETPIRLLIAASGTGGHLFPALATAEQLPQYQIEWLGVPDRLETRLVPCRYQLHTVRIGGFQGRLGLGSLRLCTQLARSVLQVRRLLRQGQFAGVLTTGGYIAAPAIIAARSLGLPAILHESNALPGKVTRWLSPWCTVVALGFEAASSYLPKAQCTVVGTPVRSQFLAAAASPRPALGIPEDVPLIVVIGGSQGAVAVNRLVRQATPAWLKAGIWVVHQTGENDPDAESLVHEHYLRQPFFEDMAPLLLRADLAISRAGAGTLTELSVTGTPAILIPYPFAAEDHQAYNAAAFAAANAAMVIPQADLSANLLQDKVSMLLDDRPRLMKMAAAASDLAIPDSAQQLASLVQQALEPVGGSPNRQ
ncbi:UDP-N-acetylglucosamine--N-acetylmuramyl-(pentapeptide) pyrophosphoryl-undecaprenol N-acetylglucosamine transferase [Halomicronema hongdechloris C2206]|uniref:UDP-N-acetylglucosamine--N-acetylmuramyl-(pentapeptide) pyrophosphoryl-undecaprenol N-acetylglucosamine transferase n=1 Tax=Halomicronema hongdechloris C2206 TaxID=1641165 RepID=A0A1Z3HPR0_9CYAN|nr:UDP-N-acetylglucosamine--N-acetylmuramyl-(pentapeptide) pyrophosphoryl-undecaprenol N-acetylglucosamine transferase [Halomicronema hongdechloris C2206]